MYVGLGVIGDVVVDDVADALHVQAARSHIGGDDDIELAAFEPLDGFLTQRLVHVAVERGAGITARFELLRQFHGGGLGAHEDDQAVERLHLENPGQGIEFVHATDLPVALGNRRHRGGLGLDADLHRVLEVGAGNPADRLGHSGGEQCNLALGRGVFEDLLHIVDKAHAQHLIGLIEHHRLKAVELEGAAAQMVLHPPGRAHHHMHPAAQLAQLHIHGLAAVDRQDMEAGQVTGVGLHRFGHLERQLAGRRQHQDLRLGQAHIQPAEQRQGKGGGLAGAGLGHAQQVAPGKQRRDTLGLYRRGGLVTDLFDRLKDRRSKGQLGKADSFFCRHGATYGWADPASPGGGG